MNSKIDQSLFGIKASGPKLRVAIFPLGTGAR